MGILRFKMIVTETLKKITRETHSGVDAGWRARIPETRSVEMM